jgi:hypothetical protein
MSAGADDEMSELAMAAGREEMLELLEDGIREAHRKVESGRVYDEEKERVRQGWIRVLAYSVGQYRQLVKDKDIEEMKERLDEIDGGGEP